MSFTPTPISKNKHGAYDLFKAIKQAFDVCVRLSPITVKKQSESNFAVILFSLLGRELNNIFIIVGANANKNNPASHL